MRLFSRRVHSRRSIQLEAQLITSSGVSHALLEDLSENGAKLSLGRSLEPEEDVVVRWACYAAIGRVAWVNGKECGLEFDRQLDTRVVAATQAAAGTRRGAVVPGDGIASHNPDPGT